MAVTRTLTITADAVDNDPPGCEFDLDVSQPHTDPDTGATTQQVTREHFIGVPKSSIRRGDLRRAQDGDDLFFLFVRTEDHDRLGPALDQLTLGQASKLNEFLAEVYLSTPTGRPRS